MSTKYVYFFGDGQADGDASMKSLLGGKGANLAEMVRIGLPGPAGFTLTTEVCTYYYANNRTFPPELKQQVLDALKKVEKSMGAEFGSSTNPLLFSCRSGARESMPGMMDTVLNIGLNDTTVVALAKQTGNERSAWDSYRRFVQMYGDVVLELKPKDKTEGDPFEVALEHKREKAGVQEDSQLSVPQLKELVAEFKQLIKTRAGKDFPTDPMEQVWGAIGAVFGSWMNDRAMVYRRTYGIPHEWGTAANVQAMVFGNLGDDCATGVGLTRDCALGTPGFCGDYLINAQGEDVVAGIRTPKRIEETLSKDMPESYEQLNDIGKKLEKHYKEVQDIEFTIQRGKVYMLQTRNAKRTGFAAVRIAVDLVNEGLITEQEALQKRRIPADDLAQLLQPIFDPASKATATKEGRFLAKGINAGPGAASGVICLFADEAEKFHERNPNVDIVLVRKETSPEDLRGMKAAKGILTATGGASSHAALVSRQMGKACIVGCSAIDVDYSSNTVKVAGKTLKAGDFISMDGFTGEVFEGKVQTKASEVIQVLVQKTLKPEESETFRRYSQLMGWVDKFRKLRVRTNADTPAQADEAVAFGAEGIGLCRTEHMFFEGERIIAVREMILAETEDGRRAALAKLLPMQRKDFAELFEIMTGLPVTIRLLDPPLHEFLPHTDAEIAEVAAAMKVSPEKLRARAHELSETNPMLGFRGVRLAVRYPEIAEMQARAIFEGAVEAGRKTGTPITAEIMVPLVMGVAELDMVKAIIVATAEIVARETGVVVPYHVGTMIELPRAALRAGEIAKSAEFFSFGTNDLTQTTLGVSRDDAASFLGVYTAKNLLPADPFVSIDVEGVGELVKLAAERGVCGEHGGDPASIAFCENVHLDYVSCSPFRIPIARLAAAQAALGRKAASTA